MRQKNISSTLYFVFVQENVNILIVVLKICFINNINKLTIHNKCIYLQNHRKIHCPISINKYD